MTFEQAIKNWGYDNFNDFKIAMELRDKYKLLSQTFNEGVSNEVQKSSDH